MTNSFFRYCSILVLIISIAFAGVSCKAYRCPANNGGYIDYLKPMKQKRHKPQTGLWPKSMRH